jgi:hypothetical protein
VLRAQGATGKSAGYGLGDAFFEQMEDHWTFCSALSDIYAVKEMQDHQRDDDVAATLPSVTAKEQADDLFVRLVTADDLEAEREQQ